LDKKICYLTFLKAAPPQPFLWEKEEEIKENEYVVAEGDRGVNLAKVLKIVNVKDVHPELPKKIKKIIRKATEDDIGKFEKNKIDAEEAYKKCLQIIEKHKLNMKLVKAEYMLDRKKLVFYFTADGRVDFRELVKDLAKEFRVRIEMRQIGVRDETKIIGCIGNCGLESCCSRFLYDFQPISIKIAKEQNLVMNPSKISGVCGRLMCCLLYEYQLYVEKLEESKISLSEFEEQVNEDELKKLEG
jgi:cell fate regulator YaaT (PSP1 superfamily)